MSSAFYVFRPFQRIVNTIIGFTPVLKENKRNILLPILIKNCSHSNSAFKPSVEGTV